MRRKRVSCVFLSFLQYDILICLFDFEVVLSFHREVNNLKQRLCKHINTLVWRCVHHLYFFVFINWYSIFISPYMITWVGGIFNLQLYVNCCIGMNLLIIWLFWKRQDFPRFSLAFVHDYWIVHFLLILFWLDCGLKWCRCKKKSTRNLIYNPMFLMNCFTQGHMFTCIIQVYCPVSTLLLHERQNAWCSSF